MLCEIFIGSIIQMELFVRYMLLELVLHWNVVSQQNHLILFILVLALLYIRIKYITLTLIT